MTGTEGEAALSKNCCHIALILARGGSKRVPRKALQLLGGRTLIEWTIDQALSAQVFEDVVVSTDCDEIRSVAMTRGAHVPFLRPPELATDTATSASVLIDHVRRAGYDAAAETTVLTLLQPTSPFRRVATIRRALTEFEAMPGSSLIGVTRPAAPLEWIRVIDRDGGLLMFDGAPHSDESVCVLSGLIYISSVASLIKYGDLYGARPRAFLIESRLECLDIDTLEDLEVARALVQSGHSATVDATAG